MPEKLSDQAVDILKELMAVEGLSAIGLSAKSGVPQPTISRVLRGDRIPTLDTFERMLAGMGVRASIEIEPL